ncbi:MAG: hypothetical protein H6Q20_224 [Bacteroidetes bacterium]|nr:hypothetical protein [Bacteroidota bacterium]
MNKSILMKSSAVIMAALLLFASCASSTVINSIPSGAKIYINGEPVGTTPYLYSDTRVIGSVVNVDLKKDGYEPLYTSFRRNEKVDPGAIVGGLFFLFPFIWTMQYKSSHTYELVPVSTSQNVQTPAFENELSILNPQVFTQNIL